MTLTVIRSDTTYAYSPKPLEEILYKGRTLRQVGHSSRYVYGAEGLPYVVKVELVRDGIDMSTYGVSHQNLGEWLVWNTLPDSLRPLFAACGDFNPAVTPVRTIYVSGWFSTLEQECLDKQLPISKYDSRSFYESLPQSVRGVLGDEDVRQFGRRCDGSLVCHDYGFHQPLAKGRKSSDENSAEEYSSEHNSSEYNSLESW